MSRYISALRIPYYVFEVNGEKYVTKSKLKAYELSDNVETYIMSHTIHEDGVKFVDFKNPIEDFPK